MIYSHYPDAAKWALVSPVPRLEEFWQFPQVTTLLFSIQHEKLPVKGFYRTRQDNIDVPAFLKIDSSIEFELEDTLSGAKISVPIVVSRDNKQIKIFKIPIAEKGAYRFKIGKRFPLTILLIQIFIISWN